MSLAHVTQTGNVSIPKQWRDELGIEPNSKVIIEKKGNKLVIEPLKAKDAFGAIDKEIKRKGIRFTRKEAIKDELYD